MKIDFGPLENLLSNNAITEIMVNAPDRIFVEQQGILTESPAHFIDERALLDLIHAILRTDQKDLTQSSAFDGILPNGSRYNIALPPMTGKYPSLTIRKFHAKGFSVMDLIANKTLSEKAGYFLARTVKAKTNILISGGTGSGKTSFLQALSFEIPESERLITIEDVAELKVRHKNQVQLFSSKQISTRDCVVNSLRMRPDRIIVGECRRDEAFDMLQAMNTGHEGSMTTMHANSPHECLTRLENLLYMSKLELPLKALRTQIAHAVNLVIQIKRFPNGQRRVTEIIEISGMEGDVITKASVFVLNNQQELVPTGYVPRLVKTLASRGQPVPDGFFIARTAA